MRGEQVSARQVASAWKVFPGEAHRHAMTWSWHVQLAAQHAPTKQRSAAHGSPSPMNEPPPFTQSASVLTVHVWLLQQAPEIHGSGVQGTPSP